MKRKPINPAAMYKATPYGFSHAVEQILAFYGDTVPAANTWIGVQALAMPDFLIEIEATAVLD